MKTQTILVLIICVFLNSCTTSENKTENVKDADKNEAIEPNDKFDLKDDRTYEEKAQDALNVIQVKGSNLYSTFANIHHRCKADYGTYQITSEEFENALLDLLIRYYPNIPPKEKEYLAHTVAMAGNDYSFRVCGTSTENTTPPDSITPPKIGMWVFQEFTEETDLVILW